MVNSPSDKTIVLHLLRGAVPERADEISGLWKQHGHEVEVAPNARGSTMNATSKRIRFDTKTVDFFWLIGFSAWRAIEVYAPALTLATATGLTLEAALNIDEERALFEQEYKHRFACSKSLLSVSDASEVDWPDDVPQPTNKRDSLDSNEQKLVYDLILLGLAFAFLHEFKHVQARVLKSDQEKPEEEMACDTWARDFMTTGLAEYAKKNGHSYAEVEQKRAMGIVLAAVTIHAMTPHNAYWGSDEYPPIGERLIAMIDGYNLPFDSPFWVFTGCLLVALMRQDNRKLEYTASSSKDFVLVLLGELR